MMTAKVNLNSVATANMSSEQAKTLQLHQREESTNKIFENKQPIHPHLLKYFDYFGAYQTPFSRKSSKGTHEYHISTSEEKQLINILNLEGPKAAENLLTPHQNILNYVRVDQPEHIKTHPLNIGGFAYLESA